MSARDDGKWGLREARRARARAQAFLMWTALGALCAVAIGLALYVIL